MVSMVSLVRALVNVLSKIFWSICLKVDLGVVPNFYKFSTKPSKKIRIVARTFLIPDINNRYFICKKLNLT